VHYKPGFSQAYPCAASLIDNIVPKNAELRKIKLKGGATMQCKWFKIMLILAVLFFGQYNVAQAQGSENSLFIFSFSPAVSFAWYPFAFFFREASTDTNVDINNFGISASMGLKFFDRVGVHLNLKIDDPAFQRMVDFAGYITTNNFMLRFGYHAFGGTVRWSGVTPNPIPGEVYNFRNQWTDVSLMFRIDQIDFETAFMNINNETLRSFARIPIDALHHVGLLGYGRLTAIGLGFAQFDMPLEYQIQPDRRLFYPGFGSLRGQVWGLSIYTDSLSWRMHPVTGGFSGNVNPFPFAEHIWIHINWFSGFRPFGSFGEGRTDSRAIAWMNDNNALPVNGNINRSLRYSIFKASLGFQHIWEIGERGRIGLAVGVQILEETIDASNNDIKISFWSRHIGPAIRASVRI